MDITRLQADIQQCSDSTGDVFSRLGTAFPTLLEVSQESEGNASLSGLSFLLSRITEGFSAPSLGNEGFFAEYNERTARLFENLSERMTALNTIHERVDAIKTDSEELELISLNAMVISIKSGEKGRAFSCITENLKRLSAQLISISNDLIREEGRLFEKNDALKTSFASVLSARELKGSDGLANSPELKGSDGSKDSPGFVNSAGSSDWRGILTALSSAESNLASLREQASLVAGPIRKAMAGIQLQDIVRQSNDQILLALGEISTLDSRADESDSLDRLSFDHEILELCRKIAEDVEANIASSIDTFSSNWEEVNRLLDEIERQRRDFLKRYLDRTSREGLSLSVHMEQATASFSDFMAHVSLYQQGQKTMVRDSASIVTEVKDLKKLFETIRPVISRLQHVRITQQIETAKNAAIATVKDTVAHMSDLIMRSEDRVESTRRELESFIAGIGALIDSFSADAARDSRELERIKREGRRFYQEMEGYQQELSSSLAGLRVYPDSFTQLCLEVNAHIGRLSEARKAMALAASRFESLASETRAERDRLIAAKGLSGWDIKNDRLRSLVTKFTITAHKEAAGKIAGFDVEETDMSSIESGDVTLFF